MYLLSWNRTLRTRYCLSVEIVGLEHIDGIDEAGGELVKICIVCLSVVAVCLAYCTCFGSNGISFH